MDQPVRAVQLLSAVKFGLNWILLDLINIVLRTPTANIPQS